jgi:hypothetical protein
MNGIALLHAFAGFCTGVVTMAVGTWLLIVIARDWLLPKS